MSRTYIGTITGGGRGQLWHVELGEDAPVHLRTLFLTTPSFPVAIGQRVRVSYAVGSSYGLWFITEVLPKEEPK
jgi:hypothetical protein